MAKVYGKIALVGLLFWLLGMASLGQAKPAPTIGQRFAELVMARWPDPTAIHRNGWEYNSSIVLVGMAKIYQKTHETRYLKYIQKWVDFYIDNRGEVAFNEAEHNLDRIHPGQLLLFLYEQTGREKYKLAAATIRRALAKQPRNAAGGFWHKGRYPNEMWLDGIYMAEPFLIRYGVLFNEREQCAAEAAFQTTLIAKHTQDPRTGLLVHGWDQDKNAVWADPPTGRSQFVWCRGMGWYTVALVELLRDLPKDHPQYGPIVTILQKAAAGLKATQDPTSGLWYQVLDRRDHPDNWPETSGSAMFVYALQSAVNQGYLDSSYAAIARKGWDGLQTKLKLDGKFPAVSGAVEGMGVQSSYAEYVNKERLTNSTHGLCGVLFAASVMED